MNCCLSCKSWLTVTSLRDSASHFHCIWWRVFPRALLAPFNIIKLNMIGKTGRVVEKDRLTYDQSYRWGSGTSINSCICKEDLPPCLFVAVICCIINWVVTARVKFANTPILVGKLDFWKAIHCLQLAPATLFQTCTPLPREDIAIMMLHLTFGSSPCLTEWGVLSEAICNLTGAIIRTCTWDLGKNLALRPEHLTPTYILQFVTSFHTGKGVDC